MLRQYSKSWLKCLTYIETLTFIIIIRLTDLTLLFCGPVMLVQTNSSDLHDKTNHTALTINF